VARDAARGVGGVEEGGNELTVRGAVLSALKLSRCKASDVDMELVQSGVVTIAGELDLELQLILRDGLAAHRAYVSARSWALQIRVLRPLRLLLRDVPPSRDKTSEHAQTTRQEQEAPRLGDRYGAGSVGSRVWPRHVPHVLPGSTAGAAAPLSVISSHSV